MIATKLADCSVLRIALWLRKLPWKALISSTSAPSASVMPSSSKPNSRRSQRRASATGGEACAGPRAGVAPLPAGSGRPASVLLIRSGSATAAPLSVVRSIRRGAGRDADGVAAAAPRRLRQSVTPPQASTIGLVFAARLRMIARAFGRQYATEPASDALALITAATFAFVTSV